MVHAVSIQNVWIGCVSLVIVDDGTLSPTFGPTRTRKSVRCPIAIGPWAIGPEHEHRSYFGAACQYVIRLFSSPRARRSGVRAFSGRCRGSEPARRRHYACAFDQSRIFE